MSLLVRRRSLEERRRRELLLVPRDDELATPIDRADGVVGSDLRGFVEDHDIEPDFPGVQVSADGQGTHHQARLQPEEDGRNPREELPEGEVTLLLVDFAEQYAQFGGTGCIERGGTGAGGIIQAGFRILVDERRTASRSRLRN